MAAANARVIRGGIDGDGGDVGGDVGGMHSFAFSGPCGVGRFITIIDQPCAHRHTQTPCAGNRIEFTRIHTHTQSRTPHRAHKQTYLAGNHEFIFYIGILMIAHLPTVYVQRCWCESTNKLITPNRLIVPGNRMSFCLQFHKESQTKTTL